MSLNAIEVRVASTHPVSCATAGTLTISPREHSTFPAHVTVQYSLVRTSGLSQFPGVHARAQVDGHRYALFECVYLRPWPNAAPWIARIEEILSRIGRNNKVQHCLGVRWFYRRHDLLPAGAAEFPECDDPDHEVYMSSAKLDEVETKTLARYAAGCMLVCPSARLLARTLAAPSCCNSADVCSYRAVAHSWGRARLPARPTCPTWPASCVKTTPTFTATSTTPLQRSAALSSRSLAAFRCPRARRTAHRESRHRRPLALVPTQRRRPRPRRRRRRRPSPSRPSVRSRMWPPRRQ